MEGLSDKAMRILTEYEWPGNVRELENVIQRAVVLCRAPLIQAEDLDVRISAGEEPALPEGEIVPLKEAMKKAERRLILDGLKACGGNRKQTAERLGITERPYITRFTSTA